LDFPGVSVISVGIRNISAGEIPFLEANRDRVRIHWGRDRRKWDPAAIVAPLTGRKVYLTFDVDGLDSSIMPATGTPEPGGLLWEDAMAIISAAAGVCEIIGADVNELAPIKGHHAPDFLVAKLVYKILSAALIGPPPGPPIG
ncbi:MAG: arginase family protein, partial [Myxococcales bacterium]|nr:arginase family protein [Myxococcales bacterium]